MSRLALPNGDDHPEAAAKHLDDAYVLHEGNRYDGARYLAGYVVECSIKALYLVENGVANGLPSGVAGGPHNLAGLLQSLLSLVQATSGATTASYLTSSVRALASAKIAIWNPTQRYWEAGRVTAADAADCILEAATIFDDTVAAMRLDGVL